MPSEPGPASSRPRASPRMLADGAITAGDAAGRRARSSPRASTCASAREAFRVRASFLPGPAPRVAERLADFEMHRIDLGRRRGAGEGLRLPRAAGRGAGAARGRLGGRQRQELDRPARPLHPADHRPRHRVRPDRGRLRRPALRRDLAALVLGAGAAGHAAEPDPLPPRRGRARRRARCARSTPPSGWSTARRTSPAASPSRSTSSRAPAASSATAPSRTPG